MLKAPTKAHALISTEHNLAAQLTDREVQQSIVARLAGQTGAGPDDFWFALRSGGTRPLRAPAERANECLRPTRRGDTSRWVRDGAVVSIDYSGLIKGSISTRMVSV